MGGLRGEEKWRPDRIGAPEVGEIRRSRREGPSRTGGGGEERRAFAPPTRAQKPAGLPSEVPCPLRPRVGGMAGPLLFC